MGRKKNEFEVIVPLNDDVENMISERTEILKDKNILNRLNVLERDNKCAYSNLARWVYNEFKSTVPGCNSEQIEGLPLMSVLKVISSNKFNIFLDMLGRCEDTVEFNKNHEMKEETKEEAIARIKDKISNEQYISFTVARYALTDVIEELHKSYAKDIIVTKEDDNLVVKYKPRVKLIKIDTF